MHTFGKRLQMVMNHYSLKQDGMRSAWKVGSKTLYNYLQNKQYPNWQQLLNFFEAFPEIDKDWFIEGKGSMLKNNPETTESVGNYGINNKDDEVKRSIKLLIENFRFLESYAYESAK
jgi:hypothetical protein